MGPNFRGRIISSKDLRQTKRIVANGNASQLENICCSVLIQYRNAIETSNEQSQCKLYLGSDSGLYGNHFDPARSAINLDYKSMINAGNALNSADVVFGSLGHELGHFYIGRIFGSKTNNSMWGELMADYLGGFLFGLDKDRNPLTKDLDISGRYAYFPYLCKQQGYPLIPGWQPEGIFYYELLDGVHPFTAARINAICMGYDDGCGIKLSNNTCIGLSNLKKILIDFTQKYEKDFYSTFPVELLQALIDFNEKYNKSVQGLVNKKALVYPPKL